jgi:hypothetical protein
MERRTAPPFCGSIHNIIVNERCPMQEFEGRRRRDHLAGFDANGGGGSKG